MVVMAVIVVIAMAVMAHNRTVMAIMTMMLSIFKLIADL